MRILMDVLEGLQWDKVALDLRVVTGCLEGGVLRVTSVWCDLFVCDKVKGVPGICCGL